MVCPLLRISRVVDSIYLYPAGVSAPPDVIENFERTGEELLRVFMNEETFSRQGIIEIKERIVERLKGDGRVVAMVKFSTNLWNLITVRHDNEDEFLLRAHSELGDCFDEASLNRINENDSQLVTPATEVGASLGVRQYWSTVPSIVGSKMPNTLVEVAPLWSPYEAKRSGG